MDYTPSARRLGIISATVTAALLIAYAVTLTVGFASLESPNDQIGEPMFTMLEVLIIVMMPAMVGLMVAIHAWAPPAAKCFSLTAVVFMGLLCVMTCGIHFVVLTVSRHPAFAGQPWLPLLIGFEWPSVAYALDILGWDFFFPLSMLFAATVFGGSRLAVWVRWMMIASGVLALAGLIGVLTGSMQLRNIGIVGYVGVFLVVVVLLAVFFYREKPMDA